MLNSSIGPVINTKKFNKAGAMQKKPMTPGMSMYSMQLMNQNKMQMPMGMQPNMMNGMKAQDPNMTLNQQQPSMPSMKIENISLQSAKKVNPQFMVNKGMVSSPSLSQTSNPGKETDLRFQMPSNPINMPLQQPLSNLNQINTVATPQKVNDKELVKPSEISTTTLRIGTNRFHKDCKIITKIIFGKKQFIWEITEVTSPAKNEEDNKGVNKRRFELKFSDIEKIEINTETSYMQIEAKEKPAEYKEHNSQLKKNPQWIKEATYETESEFGEEDGKNGIFIIAATFPKDSLTKNQPGKLSHLDKLKKSEITLIVDGKALDSVPSTPLKSNTLTFGQADGLHPFAQPTGLNFSQMAQIKREMSFPDLSIQSQHSIPFNTKDPFYGNDLNLFKDPSERMQEEMSQQEVEEDDEEKEFPPLTKDKKIEAKKFESQLKAMKNEDKIDFIMETIKPKRFGINMQSKKIYKCPLYKCSFQKNTVSHLKNHLQHKHKRVLDMGFNIDETGGFTWKPELTDFAIMVAKIYPNFVKNIIKEAKKMP